jgi:hypothetical protein
MKKNLLILIALLIGGFINAQTVRQSSVLIDEGTEFGSPSFQLNEVETDAISIWSLPSTGATSGNTRIPGNTFRYQRTEYLITAAEMAASNFPVGQEINSIGFLIAAAGGTTHAGTFTVYLKNTADATYSLGTSWDITGFTKVSEIANWTVPIALGSYEVPFSGGSSFTYTGGGIYIAWEFSNPSGTLGTAPAVSAYCNLNLTAGLMGQRSSTSMPTALVASNWRPATIFGNNFYTDIIQVTNIYTNERNPIPFGAPTPIDVRVANVSAAPATFNVTVTVKDPTNTITRYTSTQTVTGLAANSASVLNFTGWNPTIKEEAIITATTSAVAGENWDINNTLSIPCSVNDNLYSYNYNNTGAGGFGFTYPGTGIFAAKYTMNGQGKVTGANLVIANSASNTGSTIYAVVLNSAGAIVAQSADYVITAGDLGLNKNFTFPVPPVFTDEVFYIGLAQTAGTAQYFPMGTFPETPKRENIYFETTITGGVLDPLGPTWNIKFGIEAIVAPNFELPLITTTAASSVAHITATVNGTVMANSNSVAVSFEYGTTTAYGNTAAGTPATVTGTTVTPVLSNLTGLLPLTTYHYRAVGSIGLFKYYGADLTFTTTAPPPTVVTTAATGITDTEAILNGTVNANTATATVTFEYGPTTAYGTVVNATPNSVPGNTATPVSASIAGLTVNNTYHYRVVAVNSGGTSYGNDVSFVAGCISPGAAGAITGLTSVCQNTTTVIYDVAPISEAVTYVWTLPSGATITAGDGTNSITVTFGTTAVSGNITVSGSNGCGTGTPASLPVTVNPMPVPALVGPLSVCVGTSGVIYQTDAGMTNYDWSISAGGVITAGAGTNSVTVNWNTLGSQTLSVNYTNALGCSGATPHVFDINIVDRPVPVITGPANACLGFTTNVYTTEAGNSGYNWTVSAGGVITAGAGTNAITVTWNTVGPKTVSVNYTIPAGCNALAPSVYAVTVNPTPSPSITGITELCAGATGVVYTTQANFSNYVWNISYGGTITAGIATNEVIVNWATAGSRTISVNYNNALGCSAINSSVLDVTVNSTPVPVISGSGQECQGATGVAYTTQANFDNYVWSVSTGGTITSGAGTNAITVSWIEAGNMSVSVSYSNDLGCPSISPTVYPVVIDPKPAAAGAIAGTTPVCAGATMVTYTTAPLTGISTFLWTLPAGATIVEGANTRIIKVNFAANASSGIIKVSGVNDCGPGPSSPNFNVVVNPLPSTPVITQNGDTLSSSANTGNQWYLNGVIIPGATGKQHVAVYTGTYTVVVTVNECSSSPSNGILVLPVSVTVEKANRTFEIYPNPNTGEFNIKVETLTSEVFNIEIYNSLGSLIWKQENVTVNGTFTKHIVLTGSPSGMYMVKLRNNDNAIVKKLIIKN